MRTRLIAVVVTIAVLALAYALFSESSETTRVRVYRILRLSSSTNPYWYIQKTDEEEIAKRLQGLPISEPVLSLTDRAYTYTFTLPSQQTVSVFDTDVIIVAHRDGEHRVQYRDTKGLKKLLDSHYGDNNLGFLQAMRIIGIPIEY